MKIGRYEFKAAKVQFGSRMRGVVTVPAGARVVHMGVAPDLKGNICLWVEETSIALAGLATQMDEREFLLLKHGDEIPPGYSYAGHILSSPILLVYERGVAASDAAGGS